MATTKKSTQKFSVVAKIMLEGHIDVTASNLAEALTQGGTFKVGDYIDLESSAIELWDSSLEVTGINKVQL